MTTKKLKPYPKFYSTIPMTLVSLELNLYIWGFAA